MTEGRSLLLFISIFSTFAYLLHLMSVGSHCAWMKGEAQGSMLCQLGVSFLPAGFCISPLQMQVSPFSLVAAQTLQSSLSSLLLLTRPDSSGMLNQAADKDGSLQSLGLPPSSFPTLWAWVKRFSNSMPQFPLWNGEHRGNKPTCSGCWITWDHLCRIWQTLKLYKR